MVTVTTYREVRKNQVQEFHHKLEQFPNYADMKSICEEDEIRADDFCHIHKSEDGMFYVGAFLANSTTKGKHRGLRFFIRCDEKPTYKELAR